MKPLHRISHILALPALTVGLFVSSAASAEMAHDPMLRDLVASQLRAIAQDSAVVAAIQAQNAAHAALTQAEIDSLDLQWRAETGAADRPLISKVLGNALSAYLKQALEHGQGVYTEIFVMDDKGLNVGQSDVTSDYWQGDEDKWQKTFPVGADAVFVDEVEKDESTQQLQSQVSFSIVDPATNTAIGAITFGINLDELGG
jgi:hypothetical protein